MLDALDDKIELNRRMSQTLESMARALFKSWFVDFDPVRAKSESRDAGLPRQLADLFPGCWDDTEIGPAPVGWHVAPLSALCTPMVGGDWGDDVRSDRSPTAVRCLRGVDLHALRASGWSKVPVRYISESSAQKRNLQPSDVIIEASGECGRSLACSEALLSYFGQPIIYSNFCRRMRTESPAAAFFVEHVLNELVRSGEMKTYVTGTAMPNLDVSGLLNSVTIAVPPTQILEAWAQLADVARRVRLSAESRALANVKDLLLPSLMCGQPTCAA
jgi:type I restriction enzyme S subunit